MSAGRERHDTQLHVIKPGRFRERIQLLRHNDGPRSAETRASDG